MEKHWTQRSYSLQALWAHLIRTYPSNRLAVLRDKCDPTPALSDVTEGGGVVHELKERGAVSATLTVEVISAEQTSQTYLTPPSPPLAAVFLRMTPISNVTRWRGWGGDYRQGPGLAGLRRVWEGPKWLKSREKGLNRRRIECCQPCDASFDGICLLRRWF